MEIWKDVIGFEGLYQVSNLGRVRSVDRMVDSAYGSKRMESGRIINSTTHYRGYEMVNLRAHGKRYYRYVHRLVAEAFLPNPDGLPCVNHKDEDKKNNSVTNLEWCTFSYNTCYYYEQKRTQLFVNTVQTDEPLLKPYVALNQGVSPDLVRFSVAPPK